MIEKLWGSFWIGRDLIEEESEVFGLENFYYLLLFIVLMGEIFNKCVIDCDIFEIVVIFGL